MADTADAPAAPVETPAAEPETTSLADHAALFGPPDPTLEGEAKAQNEEARAKVRHRARSQQAGPEDAPRIAELTKRLRETEAERDALRTATPVPDRRPASTGAIPASAREAAPASESLAGVRFDQLDEDTGLPVGWTPTRPEPSIDDIGTKYATYEAFTRQQARWVHEQLDAVREARQQVEQQARQHTEATLAWNKAHATYGERLTTFKAQHTDFDALLEAHGTVNIPAAPYRAILDAETGPAWVYHLMQHPDQLAELALLFDGKPASEAMVAHATRWLSSRAKAEAAPPAAPALTLAPRPPSPVKTGPTHAEPTPDDMMSIEAHEKQFLRRRR